MQSAWRRFTLDCGVIKMIRAQEWYSPRGRDGRIFKSAAEAAAFVVANKHDVLNVRNVEGRTIVTLAARSTFAGTKDKGGLYRKDRVTCARQVSLMRGATQKSVKGFAGSMLLSR
jgi:hypothetical protein